MPVPDFLEKLRSAGICISPALSDLTSDHLGLISIQQKTKVLTVYGGVRFERGKLTWIEKSYNDLSNQLEESELIIDLLAKLQNEKGSTCKVSTTTVAKPEQHTRTSRITCGLRSLEITAGSATIEQIGRGPVKGTFVNIEETLGS